MTAQVERPLAISIVSILLFLLGVSGTVLSIVGLTVSPLLSKLDVSPSFISVYLYAINGGIVIFPLLAFASYNLWKMKKSGAKLATIILLFDLTTTPFTHHLLPSLSVDAGDIIAYVIDIICLILIAPAWKHFT